MLELPFPLPWTSTTTREDLQCVDLDSFLYGLHYSLGWAGEEGHQQIPLPPALGPVTTTTVQEAWWTVACGAVAGHLQPGERRTLQHGVEALRCTGLHGLDINLTMKLGKTFEALSLAKDLAPQRVEALESRAALYYRASLLSLEQQERGLGVREPSVRLLQPAGRSPSSAEAERMRAPARLFLAMQLMHTGQDSEALLAFRELKSAEAAFHTGEIHQKAAAEERSVGGLMGEVTQRYKDLLQEAREAYYLCLDRVRGLAQPGHALDNVLAERIEEVEQSLATLTSSLANGQESVDSGAQSLATPRRTPLLQHTSTPARQLFDQNTSLREEARPSPERLDLQMRQLTGELNRTTSALTRTLGQVEEREEHGARELGLLVEQGREVVDSGKLLVDEVKTSLVPLVRELLGEVRELRRDGARQSDRLALLLQKIADTPAPAARPPAPELSEDERLLLEGFGFNGLQQQQQQQQLGLLQQQLIQHQLVQQQLARQQPYLNPALFPAVPPVATMPSVMPAMPSTMPSVMPSSMPSVMPAMPPAMPSAMPPAMPPTIPPLQPKITAAPANVVMRSCDPLPTAPAPAPAMAVTVPLQHRLGVLTPRATTPSTPVSAYRTPSADTPTPHSFQMSMPYGASPLTSSPFPAEAGPALPLTTTALLSTITTPVFSAVTPSPEKPVSSLTKARMASGHSDTPKSKTEEEGDPEEYEPKVDFTPVIPLPDKVEVVTGEEEEEVLLEDRAKLFRWEGDTKEWKERGVGQAKLLRRKDSGKVRFLMRREQTFKVCANHSILPEMKLQPMKGQVKARIWGAQDFADEELKEEKFCIRFKTEEQATTFEEKFEEATSLAGQASSPVKPKTESSKPAPASLAAFAASQKSGKWTCDACLTTNPDVKIQCAACEGARPGKEEEVAKLKAEAAPAPTVMTIGAGGGFKFGGAVAAATTQASGFSFGSPAASSVKTSTQVSGFSFGSPATTATVTSSATSAASGFSFGSGTAASSSKPTAAITTTINTEVTKLGGFSFSSTPTLVKSKPAEEVGEVKKTEEVPKPSPFAGFSFGGASSSSSLSFGAKAEAVVDSPVKTAPEADSSTETSAIFGTKTEMTFGSVASSGEAFKADPNFQGFKGEGGAVFGGTPTSHQGEGEEGAEEYEPTGEWAPVIPLPELVEVVTGEEEEEVLFSERGKLFRFVPDTKEWKERGLGDFKVLKHKETAKVRFLMRREQVGLLSIVNLVLKLDFRK